VTRRHSAPAFPDATLVAAWQSASLLLDYPDETLVDRFDLLYRAIAELPPEIGGPLARFVAHVAGTDLDRLQQEYVETFDERRRCNLYLTYFAHGDTRKRGVALLRFKQTYLASGVRIDESAAAGGELPDHLCVVLEFAATADREAGWELLLDHRAGLEVLRLSLRDLGSPWADVVEAVCRTLPPLHGDEVEAIRRLAAEGPPEEEVGLTPYGTPGFDAALAERTGPVDLPMPAPIRRGAGR